MLNVKKDFEILNSSDLSFLDSAATTQKPKYVLEKVNNYYTKYNANPHRGAYSLSMEATAKYDEGRAIVASFINAKSSDEIIFSKNATESLNLVAYSYGLENLKENDEIVLSIMEHHSNLVPWQMVAKKTKAKLKYMYVDENLEISDEEIKAKITKNTKIVGITHMSNVTGVINDVEKITKYAHKMGAKVVVDCSQSIPHMKVDVQKIDADFLVFSAHKMLAPLGLGVLYAKKEYLNKMTPFLMGGDMIEYVYEQETTFASLPNKFEAGTQNVGGVVGLVAAIKYLEKIGYDEILKHDRELTDYAIKYLSKLDFVNLYLPKNLDNHSSVISFNILGVHPHDVASILDTNNVCIRSGNHCAQPFLRYLGVDSTCRASLYLYNTKEDIDKLCEGLNKAYDMFKKYIKI